jgi:hypothetical protein
MSKVIVYGSMLLSMITSYAGMTADELGYYQDLLKENSGYITQRGDFVNITIPIAELYEAKTTYMTAGSRQLTSVLEVLIKQSTGKVYLNGRLNEDQDDLVFATSALYAQVSHLSEYLLSSLSDISYAPVRVEAYHKDENYGIWMIYPRVETFVNLGLVID